MGALVEKVESGTKKVKTAVVRHKEFLEPLGLMAAAMMIDIPAIEFVVSRISDKNLQLFASVVLGAASVGIGYLIWEHAGDSVAEFGLGLALGGLVAMGYSIAKYFGWA